MVAVVALHVAPVKALARVPRQEIQLTRDGVPDDRRLILLRADGTVATLRQFPQLSRVVPDVDLPRGRLTLRLPDRRRVTGRLDVLGAPVHARLFGKDRHGRLLDDAAVAELTDALLDLTGEPLRLVLAERTGVGWDEAPVSLLAHESARAVGAPAGGTARFRMLLEVDGPAFVEESWIGGSIEIGTARIDVSHALKRCVVIERDADGVDDWDGLRALRAARGDRATTLGVVGRVAVPGWIRVGDEVRHAHVGAELA